MQDMCLLRMGFGLAAARWGESAAVFGDLPKHAVWYLPWRHLRILRPADTAIWTSLHMLALRCLPLPELRFLLQILQQEHLRRQHG